MAVIKYEDIINKDGFPVNFFFAGTDAEATASYDVVFPIHIPCELVAVYVWYDVASSSGTLQVQSLASGTAAGSGTNLLSTAFDLSATARTVYRRKAGTNGDFLPASTSRLFRYGMSVGFSDGGTLVGLTNLSITLYFRPVNKGHYR